MAKYTVCFSCGHDEEVHLSGPHRERERKLAYYESSGLCTACRGQAFAARRAAETAAAERQAQSLQLVPLQGSEKQVAWAERIRAEVLAELKALAGSPAEVIEARADLADLRPVLLPIAQALAESPAERVHWAALADRIEESAAPELLLKAVPALRAAVALLGKAESRWWIDVARGRTAAELLKAIAEEGGA